METEGLSFSNPSRRWRVRPACKCRKTTRNRRKKRADRPRSSTLPSRRDMVWRAIGEIAAAQARSYLEKRGVSDALVREFGLGFAPAQRRGLVEYLQARDVTIDMIVEAGLAIKPDDGGVPYDRFRDRLYFPFKMRAGV
ncbi:MAG: hypothetical protein CM15mP21_2130 [Hyphomicrobiales bacterium]|nr:MAG: hypothetical protein CM15mP21_2130 [Hyphomicrobiales bacterium]